MDRFHARCQRFTSDRPDGPPAPQELPVALIALDLDDTLLGPDLEVSERARAAIARAQGRGMRVTLATGRMFRSALPYARELGLTTPLITYNGGLIKDPLTGEVLRLRTIAAPLAREVALQARSEGLTLNVYLDDTLYVAEINPDVEYYLSIAQVEPHPVGDLVALLERESPRALPTKLLICATEAEVDRLLPRLQERYRGRLRITRSKPRFIEIEPAEVNKGEALAYLARHLGVERDRVMAVGDGENDLDMLLYAGISVAVRTAPPHVRAAARYLTGSAGEEGVAEAIERWALR
ncbi:MAG: Cof-type HAD-IIB family hydrolase [Bacillota bacterium]|nr:Cof-type HAD-IIB family hydrolase [Bacillota bacterium]